MPGRILVNVTFLVPIHLWDKFRSQTETKIKLKVKSGGKINVVLKGLIATSFSMPLWNWSSSISGDLEGGWRIVQDVFGH